MQKITELINEEIAKIQYIKTPGLNNSQIELVIDALIKIDPDLKPILAITLSLIHGLNDEKIKSLYLIQLLKFYGIGNDDILSVRNKYLIDSGKLIKKSFIRSKDKESILMLLKSVGIEV